MGDLDVSLRLRLINLMAGGAREAIGDLRRVQAEAEKLNKTTPRPGTRASDWAAQNAQIKQQAEKLKEAQKAVDAYFSNIERRLAHLGMASMGFNELQRIGEGMSKPIEKATSSAVEFEKRIASIAKAGGLIGKEGGIGDSILRAAKAGNIDWKELAKGERQMVALGGGDYLEKIAGVREGLARLIKASEADAGDLYNLMYHYMHLLKMTPEQALSSAQVNYQQGKKGAFELKDLAEVMPRLIPLGQEYMSSKQISTDLVALLQILRKQTGSASEAETRARHAMTKLSDPAEAKRIEKELGLDVYKIRSDAAAKGENQLFAVLDAIAAKFKALGDAAGHVKESPQGPDHEGTVEGVDPKKLGGIARDYYFRAALEAYMKMRDELKDYNPSESESAKATAADFDQTVKTTAAALERLGIAAEEAAIRAGNTQLGLEKWVAEQKGKVAEGAGKVAENAPGATGAAMTAWNAIAKFGELVGTAGNTAIGGATALLAIRYTMSRLAQWWSKGAGPKTEPSAEAPKPGAAGAEAAKPGLSPETLEKIEQGSRLFVFLSAALDQVLHGAKLLDADYWKNRGITPDAVKKLNEENRGAGGDAGGASAQIGKAIAEAAQKGASNVDMSPAAQATMSKYAGAIEGAEGPAVAAVAALVAKLKAMLDFKATPTIQPRLIAPSGVSPSGGGSAATPGKQSKAGGNVYIQQAHFHGVQDPKKLHEQVMARANRDAAGAHMASLHDIDTGGVG